jgi:hypothetical protein
MVQNMTDWQPIDTAPENIDILIYSTINDASPYCVDRFTWVVEVTEQVESESRNAKGRRRVVQEHEERRREWNRDGWGAEYWMHLPAPPVQPAP